MPLPKHRRRTISRSRLSRLSTEFNKVAAPPAGNESALWNAIFCFFYYFSACCRYRCRYHTGFYVSRIGFYVQSEGKRGGEGRGHADPAQLRGTAAA